MHPIIKVIFENNEEFSFIVFEDICPNAVNGLIEAINLKAYDNMQIERIVPEFVLQPWYDETTKPEFYNYVIDNEVNNIQFAKYSIGLAGDGVKTSAPSCFFICIGNEKIKRLNGSFMNIGEVISGFDVIDKIVNVPLRKLEIKEAEVFEPITPIIIKTVTIDLNGYTPSACNKYLI